MRNDARANKRISGRVRRLLRDKGFGFLVDSNDKEYFVHLSNCLPGVWEELEPETVMVTFEPTDTAKGPRALNVDLLIGEFLS